MATIFSFITSDSAALLQFLLLLGVIAALLFNSIQSGNRLARIDQENMQLKRDVSNLNEELQRSLAQVRNRLGRYEQLLCRLQDHHCNGEPIVNEDFDLIRVDSEAAILPEVVVELAEFADYAEHQLDPLMGSAGLASSFDQILDNAENTFQESAVVTYIDDRGGFTSKSPAFDAEETKDPDLLTRALNRSRASGQ